MKLAVIVAVHNGVATLGRCLDAIVDSTRPADEIIMVDDASTDSPEELALAHGVRVIKLDGRAQGPAHARNCGVQAAQSDVLFFVDADVALHPDALELAERAFTDDPTLAACFGSYDDRPAAPGLVSQYRNLLHHYVHQHACEEASTFWAGCGAIRRSALETVGGFQKHFGRPSIEDIELGGRLHAAGYRVRLIKEMQATHLKHWGLWLMVRTDIRDRAIPWTQILLKQHSVPNDLNLRTEARWSALCVMLMLPVLIAGFFWPPAWVALLPLVAALLALNADLYSFFVRSRGWRFGLGATLLHWLYYFYSGTIFGYMASRRWLVRYSLPLLLLATLLKGLAWSTVVPLWRAPDEKFHFLYAQQVERFGTLIVKPNNSVPKEAVKLWALIDDDSLRRKGASPQTLERVARSLEVLDKAEVKTIYVSGLGQGLGSSQFYSYHPPLYYAIVGAVQWLFEGERITVRVWVSRLVSVLMGVITVWLSYAIGLELWPQRRGRALLLGVLVSFHPHLTFLTATVTNMALEIALISATTLLSLRLVHRGMTVQRGLGLGLLVGAGLLIKVSYIAVAPLLGVVLVWQVWQAARKRLAWSSLWPWLFVVVLPLAMAGWWYRDALLSGGNTLLSSYGVIQERVEVTPWSFLLNYDWAKRYILLLKAYWNFGPQSMLKLLGMAIMLAVWNMGWHLARLAGRHTPTDHRALGDLLLMALPTLGVVAFYTYLDYRMAHDLGGFYLLQGRYYVTPIVSQMVWFGLGLILSAPGRLRPVWATLVGAGMVALNFDILFGVLLKRYYGGGTVLAQLERAARLHPVGPVVRAGVCALMVMLALALLPTLWNKQDWVGDLAIVAQ